jgi:osmotically inducible lipoprotein OsmB
MRLMNLKMLSVGAIAAVLAGCSSAPGTASQQGAVLGGATGAAVGASVTKNRALGAVIGGAVGAAGGYVVGQKTGTLDKKENAGTAPSSSTGTASADQAENIATGATADDNKDGFVTLDEIVKMEKKGLSDDEMIRRLQATGLTFDLGPDHRQYLSQQGVSQAVIDRLSELNRGPSASGNSVISK